MKTKTPIAFTLKAIVILTFTIIGFSGFTKCGAQSIVGKWKYETCRFISTKLLFLEKVQNYQSGQLYSFNSVIAWPFYSIWIELNSAFLDIWLKELSLFST